MQASADPSKVVFVAGLGTSAFAQEQPNDVLRVLRKRKAQKQEWVRSGGTEETYYKHLREQQKEGTRVFLERLRSKVQEQKQDGSAEPKAQDTPSENKDK